MTVWEGERMKKRQMKWKGIKKETKNECDRGCGREKTCVWWAPMEYSQVSMRLAFFSLASQWENAFNSQRMEPNKKQIKQTQKDSLIQSVKPHYGLIEARNKLGETHRSLLCTIQTTQTPVEPSNRPIHPFITCAGSEETPGMFSGWDTLFV